MMSENMIIAYFEEHYPVSKVRADLLEYMEEWFNGKDIVFIVPELDIEGKDKMVCINHTDQITIYKCQSVFEFETDLYVYVTVGIGRFENRDANGFYGIEKCSATLKYNFDRSLFDVEFFYSKLTELRES